MFSRLRSRINEEREKFEIGTKAIKIQRILAKQYSIEPTVEECWALAHRTEPAQEIAVIHIFESLSKFNFVEAAEAYVAIRLGNGVREAAKNGLIRDPAVVSRLDRLLKEKFQLSFNVAAFSYFDPLERS